MTLRPPEVLHGLARREQRAQHVDVELAVELGLGDLLERLETEDAGVVHQHVQPAEGPDGLRKQPGAFETSPWRAIALPPPETISATTRSAPSRLDA